MTGRPKGSLSPTRKPETIFVRVTAEQKAEFHRMGGANWLRAVLTVKKQGK